MNDTSKIRQLLEFGAEILGAASGSAIGLIGGPAGAIGGGVAGVVVAKGLTEFAGRFLSSREQIRIGAAAGLTINGIQQRLDKGQNLRGDNFFESDNINRSKAEELFEGVLSKCKNEYEEKKIKYVTKLYENVSFDSSIRSDDANQILNTVQQLSYRQLVIIALIGQNQKNKFSLRTKDYTTDNSGQDRPLNLSHDQQFVLQDFVNLYTQGIIERSDNTALLDIFDVIPGIMKLKLIGKSYFDFLSLNEMPFSDFYFMDFLNE